eukprot:511334_1
MTSCWKWDVSKIDSSKWAWNTENNMDKLSFSSNKLNTETFEHKHTIQNVVDNTSKNKINYINTDFNHSLIMFGFIRTFSIDPPIDIIQLCCLYYSLPLRLFVYLSSSKKLALLNLRNKQMSIFTSATCKIHPFTKLNQYTLCNEFINYKSLCYMYNIPLSIIP